MGKRFKKLFYSTGFGIKTTANYEVELERNPNNESKAVEQQHQSPVKIRLPRMTKAETTMKELDEIYNYINNAIADLENKFTNIVSKDAVILSQYLVTANDATELDKAIEVSPDDAKVILAQIRKKWTAVGNQTHCDHIWKHTNEASVQVDKRSREVSTQTENCDFPVHVTTQTGVEVGNNEHIQDKCTADHILDNQNSENVQSEVTQNKDFELQENPTVDVEINSEPDRDSATSDETYNIFKEELSLDELLDQAIYEAFNEISTDKGYSDKNPTLNETQINPHSDSTSVSKQSGKRMIVDEILDQSTQEVVRSDTLQNPHETSQQLNNDELNNDELDEDEIQEPDDTFEELVPQIGISAVGEDITDVSLSKGIHSKQDDVTTCQAEQNNAMSSLYQEQPTPDAIPDQASVAQSTEDYVEVPAPVRLVGCEYVKKASQSPSNAKRIDVENGKCRVKKVAELSRERSVTGHFGKNTLPKHVSRREREAAKKKEKAAKRRGNKKRPTFNDNLMGALKLVDPTAKAARLIQKEKCPMNLLELMEKRVSFKESHAQFVCINLLDITNYLHSNGVIHKNIRPKNVVLDDKGYPCLTGFEKSEITGLYVYGRRFGPKSNIEYTSPEQVLKSPVTGATDVFSIGVLGYNMIYGRSPHHDSTYKQTRENILNENFIPSFEPDGLLPKIGKRFLVSCIRKDIGKRFSLNKKEKCPLLSVEWFKDFDFPAFRKKVFTSPFMEFINNEEEIK